MQTNKQNFELLCEHEWNAHELIQDNFPVFQCSQKQFVLERAGVANAEGLSKCYTSSDSIIFSRWNTTELPPIANVYPCNHEFIQGTFDYPNYNTSETIHWHLNFANRDLFVAYGGSLYAQDEMQVLEHPILGSVREALTKNKKIKMQITCTTIRNSDDPEHFTKEEKINLSTYTMENNEATPILIQGADRKLVVAVDRNLRQGRENGLYGNNFARASTGTIAKALTVFPDDIYCEQRQRTNLIAIEAPTGGYGTYNIPTIERILRTALSGFGAAVTQTQKTKQSEAAMCVIHTGHWGTGAYGGNRVLMAILQMIAAEIAGVSKLVFYTFDAKGTRDYHQALEMKSKLLSKPQCSLTQVISTLAGAGFRWGFSDGN